MQRQKNGSFMGGHYLEALERAVREIEALQAIYAGDGVDVILRSPGREEFETLSAQLLEEEEVGESEGESSIEEIPTLTIQVKLQLLNNNNNNNSKTNNAAATKQRSAILTCNLPPGYPATASAKVYVTLEGGFTRATQDDISSRLMETAETCTGQESLMEIVQVLQDSLADFRTLPDGNVEVEDSCSAKTSSLETEISPADQNSSSNNNNNNNNDNGVSEFGRRWIWVHHITNAGRKKGIVREAKELTLGGFLKAGYPGVVVVEGPVSACDEFVIWVKGNKSRPGGFGRNWGHHVRGEIVTDSRQLPVEFQELQEDLAVLSAACRDHGLEAEFLEYVMQHKVPTTNSSHGGIVEENGK